MKKILLFSLSFLVIFFISNAQVPQVHVVNVANFSFSPDTLRNVMVGDTVRWVWVEGVHTTTCDPANEGNSLPEGAGHGTLQ